MPDDSWPNVVAEVDEEVTSTRLGARAALRAVLGADQLRPYTGIAAPFIARERSADRKRMTSARSSGLTQRSKAAFGIAFRF